jgi:hypothetical protein
VTVEFQRSYMKVVAPMLYSTCETVTDPAHRHLTDRQAAFRIEDGPCPHCSDQRLEAVSALSDLDTNNQLGSLPDE